MNNSFLKKYYIPIIIISIISLGIIAVLDEVLAVGFILLGFLTGITFLILSKFGFKNRTLYLLLLIVLVIHLGAALFIHYADFQPFGTGGGDFTSYHKMAIEMSQGFKQGSFSLEGLEVSHYYPVIIGIIYTFTLPEMLIGQLFGVWLVVLGVLFTYLIIIEIGGSKKWAFLIGLIVSVYPSYLFYGSLLLKDALVVSLALAGLLFCLKLIKNFSWRNFLVFYIILAGLIHFRFYIGYALLFTFILCWLLTSNLNLRKRVVYAIIIIPLLGFLPQISANQGFFGIDSFKGFLNHEVLTFYQEKAYSPPPQDSSLESQDLSISPDSSFSDSFYDSNLLINDYPKGYASTWEKRKISFEENPFKFLVNYLKYFSYISLGPFPWQMKYTRHLFALFETIPLFFLLFFIIRGIIQSIRCRNKLIIPLILFSFIVLLVMTVFFNNYGIITRIRIPAFISLLCLIPFGFKKYGEN